MLPAFYRRQTSTHLASWDVTGDSETEYVANLLQRLASPSPSTTPEEGFWASPYLLAH